MATKDQWEQDVTSIIKENTDRVLRVAARAPWLVYVSSTFGSVWREELGRGLVVCAEAGVVVPLILLGAHGPGSKGQTPVGDRSLFAVDARSASALALRFMGEEPADRCFRAAAGDAKEAHALGLRFFPYVVFDGHGVRVGSFREIGDTSMCHASAPS